ncbi:mucin-5AC-like isoform X2 [Oncorhynchus keta]|uniref:mucin-5AC-like isoform X2 n=1 Tax=Oncorhynchus keta TaxID=8018 RepID=UPI00227B918B|nr:mucin-5AC-like isoform X2 [Oncorhynchus keta]
MAFSPDGETLTLPPPLEVRKSNEETLKKSTSGSTSSSGSTSGSGSKVMTFKELRNRSKHSSPAYQLITEPDPDPTVITPDPDFLYNLKWRREKTDSDGIQWEYTSQAQATFLQPPPLTSLAAFREMFQKAEDAIGQPELCPSQRIGCSASEGNLWRMDGQRKEEGEKRKEEVEVRGTADGGRTCESRTTVSSPPLSLAHSQPSSYFLHPYRPGYCGTHTRPVPRTQPHSHTEIQSTAIGPNPYTTQSTAIGPKPYTTQSTAIGHNPYTTQPTAPNPYTTQSTAIGPNPYTTQSTAIGPNPYTTQSTAPNPYTTQSTTPNPYTTQSTTPNPYTTQSMTPNPYTTQSTTPNPYTTQSTAPNPYTTQSTTPNPYTTQSTTPNPYTTQLSNPFATPYTHTDINEDSHGTYSENDIDSGYSDYFKKDGGLDSAHRFGKDFKSNIDSLYRYVNESKTKERLEYGFVSESITDFDSLYCTANVTDKQPHTGSDTLVSNDTHTQGCTTPYKNVDATMMAYAKTHTVGSLGRTDTHTHTSHPGQSRTSKDLPPLPTWYLYHPKNCPIHRGAPPRLSPIGALDPPYRSGAPPPGLDASCLSSPLFPRSHTLPALAAPLYYPFLYPPIPPRKTSDTPKLIQAPPLPPTLTVRSVSFASSVQRGGTSWMGDDVKAPLRGLGLSSLCLLEKRALVSAVSVAVEAILAQFSSSRTLVQKALSGDSSVNPSLGRLVLQCLCPALRSLLSDGLKPHQSDLISGRRPNSAWGLVQASTRPGRNSGAQYRGPSTQSLYSLQARIGELPQLRQNKHRFNAFLLGLLNIKLMDFWLSHLQSCSDVLVTFYQPSSFMRLSLTSCQPLFEELLLLLQPLSLLTLNLDLLFQHHHLDPANHSPEIPSPPNQDLEFRLSPRGSASQSRGSSYLESLSELDFGRAEPEATNHNVSSSSLANSGVGGLVESLKPASLSVGSAKVSGGLAETSPQLMWVQEKEIRELAPPNVEEASLSQQAGQVIQEGWGAVVRWGGKLGQNLAELSLSAVQNQEGTSRDPPEPQTSTQARSDPPQVDGALAVPWGLGRLFGASNNPTIPTLPTRRPSQWLSPGVSVLTRMVSSSSRANQRRALEPQQVEEVFEKEMEETWDNPRPLRSVRTLCDHSGTGAELSFQKGEELVVLGGVDHDWIRCRQGDREGLVPIGYASLIL